MSTLTQANQKQAGAVEEYLAQIQILEQALQAKDAQAARLVEEADARDGNIWVVVIVKSCVNKKTGSWLVAQ